MTMQSRHYAAGLGALLCLLGTIGAARAQTDPPYKGTAWEERGTKYWEDVNVCAEGKSQSPIDLQPPGQSSAELGRIGFGYRRGGPDSNLVLSNNGHTVELLLNPADYSVGGRADIPPPPVPPAEKVITIDGRRYVLDSFHFHFPSEHLWDGKRYAMELHFVHKAAPTVTMPPATAVVGVFLDDAGNQENSALKSLFQAMGNTKIKGSKTLVSFTGSLMMSVLPSDTTYVRYAGSLTTPPCTEGVTWLVLKTPINVSTSQIDIFKAAIKTPLGIVGDAIPVNARNLPTRVDPPGLRLSPSYPEIPAQYCRFVESGTLSCAEVRDGQFVDNAVTGILDAGDGGKPRFMADVNGDGRSDYCRYVGDNFKCALQSAGGFSDSSIFTAQPSGGPPSFMADVNGDGRADYCRFVAFWDISCALATDTGFDDGKFKTRLDWGYFTESGMPRFLVDVNGDGKADYCRFVGDRPPGSYFSCALSTGTGFGQYDVNTPVGFKAGDGNLPRFMSSVTK